MPDAHSCPIEALKAFLRGERLGATPSLARPNVEPHLREIGARLTRARETEKRISLSEFVLGLAREGEIPLL